MRKEIAGNKEKRGKAQEDAVVDKRAQLCPSWSHLTCSYLHAVQSQRNWGFPGTAQSATSSTSPLEGKRRRQSAADAAKELQNEGAQSGMPFLQRPALPWAAHRWKPVSYWFCPRNASLMCWGIGMSMHTALQSNNAVV